MAEIPLFDCLNAINLKNRKYVYNKKDCSAYMLLMWFSHDKSCMPLVDKINTHLFSMSDETVYKILFMGIPKGKRYIKWDKGDKDKKLLKKEEKLITLLKEEYGFSEIEATNHYRLYLKNLLT